MKVYYRLKPVTAAKHREDADARDGSWKPLTNHQKARLAILAKAAAVAQGESFTAREMDEWRHEQAIKACGVRISEATQRHWADLKSAFEDLSGKPEKAFRTQMREGDNKRRVAMHKLAEELTKKGLHSSYAASICRAQFKCALDEATAKQLWCVFYTISNRRKP